MVNLTGHIMRVSQVKVIKGWVDTCITFRHPQSQNPNQDILDSLTQQMSQVSLCITEEKGREKPVTEFFLGDLVKVTWSWGTSETGTFIKKLNNKTSKVKIPNRDTVSFISTHKLSLVARANEEYYKPGDIVSYYWCPGEKTEGIFIEYIDKNKTQSRVEVEGDPRGIMTMDLTLVSRATEQTEFKQGDRVKVTLPGLPDQEGFFNKYSDHQDEDGRYALVTFEGPMNLYDRLIGLKRLSLVSRTTEHEFKPGDPVKITWGNGHTFTGSFINYFKYDKKWACVDIKGKANSIPVKYIYPVSLSEKLQEEIGHPRFKQGDLVTFTEGDGEVKTAIFSHYQKGSSYIAVLTSITDKDYRLYVPTVILSKAKDQDFKAGDRIIVHWNNAPTEPGVFLGYKENKKWARVRLEGYVYPQGYIDKIVQTYKIILVSRGTEPKSHIRKFAEALAANFQEGLKAESENSNQEVPKFKAGDKVQVNWAVWNKENGEFIRYLDNQRVAVVKRTSGAYMHAPAERLSLITKAEDEYKNSSQKENLSYLLLQVNKLVDSTKNPKVWCLLYNTLMELTDYGTMRKQSIYQIVSAFWQVQREGRLDEAWINEVREQNGIGRIQL